MDWSIRELDAYTTWVWFFGTLGCAQELDQNGNEYYVSGVDSKVGTMVWIMDRNEELVSD